MKIIIKQGVLRIKPTKVYKTHHWACGTKFSYEREDVTVAYSGAELICPFCGGHVITRLTRALDFSVGF